MTSTGTVRSFNPMRGFGFITAADGTGIFLHITACVDGRVPQQGDTVTYDLEQSQVKTGLMRASNVSGGTGTPAAGGGSRLPRKRVL
eukprot:10045402-Heterocapsa_arctica.AAC.1